MAQLLLRYDDELELHIQQLQEHFSINTKNKTVIKTLEGYLSLSELAKKQEKQIIHLEGQLNAIKQGYLRKLEADSRLESVMKSI